MDVVRSLVLVCGVFFQKSPILSVTLKGLLQSEVSREHWTRANQKPL